MACPTSGFGFQRTVRVALGLAGGAPAPPMRRSHLEMAKLLVRAALGCTRRSLMPRLPRMAAGGHGGGGGGVGFAGDYIRCWLEAAVSGGQFHGAEGAVAAQDQD